LVFAFNFLKGDYSSGLLVNNGAKTGLALDNDIRDTHLSAEGWEENHKLNGIDIVGNGDKRSLLGFNKSNNVVQAILDK